MTRGRPSGAGAWRACLAHPHRSLTVLVLLALGPGVGGYFFDDAFGIVVWAQETTLQDLWALRTSAALFRAVAVTGMWLQVQLFGTWAAGYLLLGLVVYAAIILLVYQCMRRCGAEAGPALLGAAAFALLPLHHIRWVYYIVQPLNALWGVLTVWCFTHPSYPHRWWPGVAGTGSLLFALFSYEQNLAIGAAVYAVAILMAVRTPPVQLRTLLWRLGPVTVLTALYAWVRFGWAGNLSFYYDVTGAAQTVLAEGPAGFLRQFPVTMALALASHTHLLRYWDYPVLSWITAIAPAAALVLCLGPGRSPRGRLVGAVLVLWWAATLVPSVDAVRRVDAESHYLFYAGWALTTALALYAPAPGGARRATALWALVFGVLVVASYVEVVQWLRLAHYARTVVTSFASFVPATGEARRYYLLDPPGSRFGEYPFAALSTAVTLPVPPSRRADIAVHLVRDLPHDPPLDVGATVPDVDTWPVVVLRWRDATWVAEPVPAWARPAVPGAPDLGAWSGPRSWAAQGWQANPHLVRVRRDATGEWFRTASRFSLLTGPALHPGAVPLAWAEVTMAVRATRLDAYGDFMFVTEADTAWDARKVVRFRIRADGAPHTYAVPILAHTRALLGGPVTRVALRPTGEPEALVRIDRIRLVPLRAAPAP